MAKVFSFFSFFPVDIFFSLLFFPAIWTWMSGSDQIDQPGKMEKEFNHSFHSFSLFLFSLFIQEFTKRKVLERALQIQVTDTAPLAGLMQVMVYGSSVAMHPMVRTFPLLSFSLSSVPKKKKC
jgi:hypothetical protein